MADEDVITRIIVYTMNVITAKESFTGVCRNVFVYPFSETEIQKTILVYKNNKINEKPNAPTLIIFDDIVGSGLERSYGVMEIFSQFSHYNCWACISSQQANNSLSPTIKGLLRYTMFSVLTPTAENELFKDFILTPRMTPSSFEKWRDDNLSRQYNFGLYDKWQKNLSIIRADVTETSSLPLLSVRARGGASPESPAEGGFSPENNTPPSPSIIKYSPNFDDVRDMRRALDKYEALQEKLAACITKGHGIYNVLLSIIETNDVGEKEISIDYDFVCEIVHFFVPHAVVDGNLDVSTPLPFADLGLLELFDIPDGKELDFSVEENRVTFSPNPADRYNYTPAPSPAEAPGYAAPASTLVRDTHFDPTIPSPLSPSELNAPASTLVRNIHFDPTIPSSLPPSKLNGPAPGDSPSCVVSAPVATPQGPDTV